MRMSHEVHDRVSLEIARRIAADLPRRPEWLELARGNLRRWRTINHDAPGLLRNYSEWEVLLEQPVQGICIEMTAETDEGQRLRQNSPFAGALPPGTIWDIKRQIRHEASST